MAGMFYSLQEAAEKLNKTEDQIKQLIKQGKLREFRDGSNLLFKVDEVGALLPKTAVTASEETPAPETPVPAEQTSQPEQPTEQVVAAESREPPEQEQAPQIEQALEDEILLVPETEVPAAESGLTEADTAITGKGISILGETDKDYPVTEDTMAETVGATRVPEKTGPTPEASLEEIEGDVNLDTFGSGSGLLDLSLQADDTSLGGILDEIYTAEGEGAEPAKSGTAAELTAEVEKILPEEEIAAPQPAPEVAAIAQPYAEMKPDVQSNTLGMLLILPLVLLIYTAIVVVAGQKGVMPSALAQIQGTIWYIVIAAAVIAGLVVGAAFMLTGDFGKSLKKPAKPKKPKKPKKAKKTPPAPQS